MNRDAMLWLVILVSPMVWFASLEATFALAPLACTLRWKAALYLVSIVSLALETGSGFLAWSVWRQPEPHLRGMALGAMTLSFFFALVILAQTVPNLILAGCE